jgi:hypothetical protein
MGQCGPNGWCSRFSGVCEPRDRSPGESCDVGQSCGDGTCVKDVCTGGAVITLADIGEACGQGCRLYLRCSDGKCREFPKEGDACQYGSDFLPQCAPGLSCHQDGRCGALGTVGDACLWEIDCASKRCVQGKCAEACAP